MRVVALVVVACLALPGCSAANDGPEPAPTQTSAAADPAATSSTPGVRRRVVTVPDLTAVEFRSAREWLEGDGLEVRADVVGDCRLLKGVVVAQQPPAGSRVRWGDEVTLTFGRRPAGTACRPLPAPPLRRAFLAWAKGSGAVPDFAPHVRLLQGNHEVRTLTADEARERGAWRLPAGYAELGPLDLLDWMDDQVLLQPSRGLSAYCLQRVTPLPPGLVERLRWSSVLMPASADACLQMAAVQVWVDDESRISAVGFLSGSP